MGTLMSFKYLYILKIGFAKCIIILKLNGYIAVRRQNTLIRKIFKMRFSVYSISQQAFLSRVKTFCRKNCCEVRVNTFCLRTAV